MNEGTEGPAHFTDVRQAREALGQGPQSGSGPSRGPAPADLLSSEQTAAQGCVCSLPLEY